MSDEDELDELDERVSAAGVPVPSEDDDAPAEDDVEAILAGMSWRKNKPSTPAPAMPAAEASHDDGASDEDEVVAGAALPFPEDDEPDEGDDDAPVVAGAPIVARDSDAPRDSGERLSFSELEEARLSLTELEEVAPPPLPPIIIDEAGEPDDEPLALRPLTLPPGVHAGPEPEGRVSLVDFGSALSHATQAQPEAPPTPFIDPTAPLPQAVKDEDGSGGKYAAIGLLVAAAIGLGWYMGQQPAAVAVNMDSAPRMQTEEALTAVDGPDVAPDSRETVPDVATPDEPDTENVADAEEEPEAAPEPEAPEPEAPEARVLTEEELMAQEARRLERVERRAAREAEAAARREAQPTESTPSPPPTPTPTPEVARPAPTPEPVLDLPAQPSREQVQAALDAVRSNVAACTESTGQVVVRVTVSGRGRVTTAVVQGGQFAGPEGSCIARAVRTARFPQFSERRFVVQYPFRL